MSIPATIHEDMEAGDEGVDDSGDSLSCNDTGEGIKARVKWEKQRLSIGGDKVKSNTSCDPLVQTRYWKKQLVAQP